VNVLLLSLGGGGGNILRSLKALFRRDLAVTQKVDPRYAERLRRAITTRFLDTNEFSLSDIPAEERLIIGARTTGRLGARHNPDVARQAFEESRSDVEALLSAHSVVILVGTGGKGTGAGTMSPIAQTARELKKLVIPIFVRPSFEWHEVEKRRYDHALKVIDQLDQSGIRLIEVLNDRGYEESDPQPQSVVWERMNLPIARGLRGLIYVLSDLSQVDPSDLSALFAGHGRLRIGFAEIDPPPAQEPSDAQIEHAVGECWQNPYYAFSKPVGTSLVCLQGDWSNIADAKIKGGLAAVASRGASDSPYTPLYARAAHAPKPWGVTALFAEYTGNHAPLAIEWGATPKPLPLARTHPSSRSVVPEPESPPVAAAASKHNGHLLRIEAKRPANEVSFSNLWEFAVAVNRGDPAALSLASNGAECQIPVEAQEVKKLLGTMWFRAVVPRLSEEWRRRLLDVLVAGVAIPDHVLRVDRRAAPLSGLTHGELNELLRKGHLPDAARADVDLMVIVGRLWGEEAVTRFQFVEAPSSGDSRLMSLLQVFHR
jgi:cell division GTPase FtsZ